MRGILGIGLSCVFLIASSPVTLAQAPSYTTRPPGAPSLTAPPGTSGPTFSVLGIPTVIRAPVAKPYCNCIGEPGTGAPMRGKDALIVPEPDRAQ